MSCSQENAKVSDVETRKIALEKSKTESQEAVTEAIEAVKDKKQVFEDSLEALKSAEKPMSEARKIQMSEDASLMEVSATKAKLEDAIQNHLSVIQDGDGGDLGAHHASLKKLFKLLALEQSMLGALECACKKSGPERSSFDTMAL